jgi:diadenosine tetraphosphate (Ap4A) HIT family hydrolase
MKYSEFLAKGKERPCPFCATPAGEIIEENKTAYLTFALAPYHQDHLLVVPKRHVVHILDIKPDELADIDRLEDKGWAHLKKLGYKSVSFAVREGESSGRTVEHIHYHVIPEVRLGDLDHNGEERKILGPAEIEELVTKLRKLA